jgi:hypothetical protein
MKESVVPPVLPPVRRSFRAIGSVVLPGPEALDEDGWKEAEAIVEKALATRPRKVRRQVRLFLRVINLLPILTTGRTLASLPLRGRTRVLDRLQRSRMLLLRRGLWGIRTLLFMGYYTQDGVRRKIGYRARPAGWSARASTGPRSGGAQGASAVGEGP